MARICPVCHTPWDDEMQFCPHDGAELPPPRDTLDSAIAMAVGEEPGRLRPGQVLGQYRIVRLLGEGGMGAVYEAEHKLLGRRVAIKVLLSDLASFPAVVQRFFNEARVVNEIRHPNIVDITDFVDAQGDQPPYMVMEYLEGVSLDAYIAEHAPLPPREVVRIAVQVCDAMQAVHDAGIVHRDLKPDNLMLVGAQHTEVKLLDFGIAKFLATEKAFLRTATGQTLGTPEYMAPEQVLGKGVDHRTDIYAMGIILFEMLTGEVPFQAASLGDIFQLQLEAQPPDINELRAEKGAEPAPAALVSVVERCLRKDKEDRFSSMRELAEALEAALRDAPEEADEDVGLTVAGPAFRGRWLATAIGLVALAVLAGWLLLRSKGRAPTASHAAYPVESDDSGVEAPDAAPMAARPDGGSAAQDALVSGRHSLHGGGALDGGRLPHPLRLLLRSNPPGARVFRLSDGRYVGETPVRVEPGTTYVVRMRGYRPEKVTVPADAREAPVVHLERRGARRRSRPRHRRSGPRDTFGTVNPFGDG